MLFYASEDTGVWACCYNFFDMCISYLRPVSCVFIYWASSRISIGRGFSLMPVFCCSVAQSCPTLFNPMDCSTPGFPVLHHLLEFAQTHVSDAIQPSRPLSAPSSAFFPSIRVFFQGVSSSHYVARVLELQLQHRSFQWILMTDFL